MKLPAELKPENVAAIIDTREQNPLDLSPLATERGTLDTGTIQSKGWNTLYESKGRASMTS